MWYEGLFHTFKIKIILKDLGLSKLHREIMSSEAIDTVCGTEGFLAFVIYSDVSFLFNYRVVPTMTRCTVF